MYFFYISISPNSCFFEKFPIMKKNIVSFVLGLLAFLLFFLMTHCAYAQEPMKDEKKFVQYDPEIGNFKLKIPVLGDMNGNNHIPNLDYFPIIVMAGNDVVYQAHFTKEEGKYFVELNDDAPLSMWEGRDYWFYGAYLDENLREQHTDFEKVWAPELKVDLTFKIKDSYLRTNALISGAENFYLNINETYFSIIDRNFDSIVHGKSNKIDPTFLSNQDFYGEYFLTDVYVPEKFLNVSGTYMNQYGEPKLYFNSIVAFRPEGELILNYRILGPGGIQVFRQDNLPVNATVYDLSGKPVSKFILGGYEDFFWLPSEISSNLFILKVDGYKAVTFPKIRTD